MTERELFEKRLAAGDNYYHCNNTMKMIGGFAHDELTCDGEKKIYADIIPAWKRYCKDGGTCDLSNLISTIYIIGVIYGMKKERAKRKTTKLEKRQK